MDIVISGIPKRPKERQLVHHIAIERTQQDGAILVFARRARSDIAQTELTKGSRFEIRRVIGSSNARPKVRLAFLLTQVFSNREKFTSLHQLQIIRDYRR